MTNTVLTKDELTMLTDLAKHRRAFGAWLNIVDIANVQLLNKLAESSTRTPELEQRVTAAASHLREFEYFKACMKNLDELRETIHD